jgi:hypothetical protein
VITRRSGVLVAQLCEGLDGLLGPEGAELVQEPAPKLSSSVKVLATKGR